MLFMFLFSASIASERFLCFPSRKLVFAFFPLLSRFCFYPFSYLIRFTQLCLTISIRVRSTGAISPLFQRNSKKSVPCTYPWLKVRCAIPSTVCAEVHERRCQSKRCRNAVWSIKTKAASSCPWTSLHVWYDPLWVWPGADLSSAAKVHGGRCLRFENGRNEKLRTFVLSFFMVTVAFLNISCLLQLIFEPSRSMTKSLFVIWPL